MASTANTRNDAGVEGLKEKTQVLRENLTDIGDAAKGMAQEKVVELQSKAQDKVEELQGKVEELQSIAQDKLEELEDFIAEQPVKSFAIAAGIGFALGVLFCRK